MSCAGTHDNETAVGWWKDSATKVDKEYLTQYLNTDGKDIAWDFIRSVYSTVSRTSIILIQVLTLVDGSSHVISSCDNTVPLEAQEHRCSHRSVRPMNDSLG